MLQNDPIRNLENDHASTVAKPTTVQPIGM